MDKQRLLSEIKKIVLQQEPEAEIILYGSYARGDHRSDSDIDILVLVEKENITWKDEEKIAHPLFDLELATSQVISPLIISKKRWYELYPNTALYKNINQEGMPI